jgi:hypothetical protein
LRQEQPWSEKKRCGLRAEYAAGGCHSVLRLSAEEYHGGRK